jgi:arginase family enzyme
MDPSQFAYLGVREVDAEERIRMRRYSMLELSATDVDRWLSTVDCGHVSLDVDSVYHEALAVSTPVPGGLLLSIDETDSSLLPQLSGANASVVKAAHGTTSPFFRS